MSGLPMRMSALSQSATPVMVRPRRSLGGLYPDVVVEETHADELEITEHPVEQGAAIHDHAYKKPVTVTIHAGVSDSTAGGKEKPSQEFYDQLLELQAKREPFDIITGKRKYENMLIKSLSAVTDPDTENCLMFTAECQEVIRVQTQVVAVPPRKNHANPAKTGATADKGQKMAQAKETPKESMLAGGFGGGKTKYDREGK